MEASSYDWIWGTIQTFACGDWENHENFSHDSVRRAEIWTRDIQNMNQECHSIDRDARSGYKEKNCK
jgi:hypothetical protein